MVVSCPSTNLTVPDPAPATFKLKVNCSTSNVAVQLRAASIVTLAVPLPLQSPLQPANVDPLDASAVSVTTVPAS